MCMIQTTAHVYDWNYSICVWFKLEHMCMIETTAYVYDWNYSTCVRPARCQHCTCCVSSKTQATILINQEYHKKSHAICETSTNQVYTRIMRELIPTTDLNEYVMCAHEMSSVKGTWRITIIVVITSFSQMTGVHNRGKGKGQPLRRHEGPASEQRCSSTLSSTSGL